MNFARLLALYHFTTLYHGGQSSRLYRIGCKVSRLFRPSRSEEYVSILTQEGYEDSRSIFVRLVRTEVGDASGYHGCTCCSMPMICDDAEQDVALCDDCTKADCNPQEHCNACGESCCVPDDGGAS